MEEFALASDRNKVLDHLIPGTEEHDFYRTLHFQHEGRFEDAANVLAGWVQRHGETQRYNELRNRQALLGYDRDPATTLARLKDVLSPSFFHERERPGEKPSYPTALDPASVSEAAWRQRAHGHCSSNSVNGFTDLSIESLLDDDSLSPTRRRDLLQRIRRPDHPRLVERILDDLRAPRSGGFGSLAIHGLLLDSQLDELASKMPELLASQEWVHQKVKRLRPGPEEDWENDPVAREAYLERLIRFTGGLAPAFNSLKAHVLYHRLELDRSKGVFDRARFLQYVTLPLNAGYREPAYLQKRENRDFVAVLSNDYRSVTLLAPVADDEPLVRDHLASFFEKAEDWRPFETYIRDSYLKRLFATTRILAGEGDMERWYALLNDPAAYQALKDRVDIDLAPTNKKLLRAEDSVSIDVFVKNVPVLVVKVFEINSLNYLLSTGREPDTAIDLDGLVATETQTVNFAEPPLRRVKRTFTFPSLRKPGTFVIELLGNGKSSRALVRKGRLRFLERIDAAGHAFTILDEKNKLLPDATLWLSGREYTADERGSCHVPFTNSPRRQTIVLKHGELATLESFDHKAESYELEAGFFADRESLLARSEAQVAVRPTLTIHGTRVPISLLEEPVLVLSSTDRHGTSTSKEIAGFELFADKESTYSFQVPQDLSEISFTLKGRVQSLSTGTKVALQVSRSYTLNQIETTDQIEDLHLARTSGGHVLSLLGKSGEPRPDRPVRITLTHPSYTHRYETTLQTDAHGRIVLGALAGMDSLVATSPAGVGERWPLLGDRCVLPRTLHMKAGEVTTIPYMGKLHVVTRELVSLLERSGDTFVRDHRARVALKDGSLEIQGLGVGDYDLLLKESQQSIALRVTAGNAQSGWFTADTRLLESRQAPFLQIVEAKASDKGVEIRLANFTRTTRVHVTATRFVPSHRIEQDLGAITVPEPRGILTTRALSHYISGRDLGDEYRYVLERKFARRFPGNMLERPGLILNPWAMRDTQTSLQMAAAGGAYGAAPAPSMASPMQRPQGTDVGSRVEGAFANLDFLGEPSLVEFDLRPDERGAIRIAPDAFGAAQSFHILALDTKSSVARTIDLPESTAEVRDQRLILALDPARHFTQKKEITCLARGSSLEVVDVTTSKVEAYETLGRAFALYATLSGDATLPLFSFVLDWPKLSNAEKGAKLSELACHELHFFISRKDPEWFAKVVVPYLRNKRAKTFLDHYLIGDDLTAYLRPWAHGRLNIVERILLGQRIAGERAAMARHVQDLFDLVPRNIEAEESLFKTAIQGSALETDDALGFGAAVGAATEKAKSLTLAGGGGRGYFAGKPADMLMSARSLAGPAAAMAPPPPPPPKAPRAMTAGKKMSKSKEVAKDMNDDLAMEEAEGGFADRFDEDASASSEMRLRQEVRQLYRTLETTKELGENNYYKRLIEEQGPELVQVNAFWRDFSRHETGPFVSPQFACASHNFTEIMLALSVLDLPFEREAPDVKYDGGRMKLGARRETIVFHEEIKEAAPREEAAPVLVSQNFFRKDDRTREENGEQVDKYVTGEMIVHTVYQTQVVLTNPTSSRQKLAVLLQVPCGAIPVDNGFKTKGDTVSLEPYSTESVEYAFYFPAPGKFTHYPVHVAKDEKLVASAPPVILEVLERPRQLDTTSWAYVSQEGTSADVFAFLEKHSIERLDLDKIAWRCKEKSFHERVLALIAKRHVYSQTLGAYSLYHGDGRNLKDWLEHQEGFLRACGLALETTLVRIDPVTRGWYEHREYAPLVNARTHKLGAKRKILNDRFASQYAQWNQVLCYRPKLGDEDKLAVTAYFLLQDRVEEALATFATIDPARVAERIQYDYLRTYLFFYGDDPRAARTIAQSYAEHPVDRWRNLFRNALAQIEELEGSGAQVVDPRDHVQGQGKLAATEPALELVVENKVVEVRHHNVAQVRVNYYLMDVELLFSRQPFVQQQSTQFGFVKPNRSDTVALEPGSARTRFPLPAELEGRNVVVEVSVAGIRRSQAYYSNALAVQVIEGYGQVRVAHEASHKPLAGVYVKAYARMTSGEVRFYKDGYTDARGRFDYASLSTDELGQVDRFAVLLLSEEHGAVIREASPPKR